MSFPPAWYPDPTGVHDHRWWDGVEWTAHVSDAGTATIDDLNQGMARASSASGAGGAPATAVTASGDRVGTVSLALGLLALPVALLPFLGLVLAGVALALALIARRRARSEGRPIPGVTKGGLATGAGAVVLSLMVTWSALSFLTSGENLREVTAIMREYLVCVEDRPAAECRSELEQALTALGEA
jgi:hypothetical protein